MLALTLKAEDPVFSEAEPVQGGTLCNILVKLQCQWVVHLYPQRGGTCPVPNEDHTVLKTEFLYHLCRTALAIPSSFSNIFPKGHTFGLDAFQPLRISATTHFRLPTQCIMGSMHQSLKNDPPYFLELNVTTIIVGCDFRSTQLNTPVFASTVVMF